MKQFFVSILIFAGAVFLFCCVTGIAGRIHREGFDAAMVAGILKSEDVQIWGVLPIAVVAGIVLYWMFNRD